MKLITPKLIGLLTLLGIAGGCSSEDTCHKSGEHETTADLMDKYPRGIRGMSFPTTRPATILKMRRFDGFTESDRIEISLDGVSIGSGTQAIEKLVTYIGRMPTGSIIRDETPFMPATLDPGQQFVLEPYLMEWDRIRAALERANVTWEVRHTAWTP